MTALQSAQWFRVARLRPVLDSQALVERVQYRRRTWHVLVRPDASRSFRLDDAAYAFAARCDGRHSLQRLWDLLLLEFQDDAPTQDELLQLLARLYEAGLIGFDRKPDFGARGTLLAASGDADPAAPRQSLLSFRIPLGRSDRLLDPIAARLPPLFGRAALVCWVVVVLLGALAAAQNGAMLVAYAKAWLATPRLLLMAWLAYPVVKALHELAHALALKHYGGHTREWGLTLLMFTPVPYVDASAATRLPRAYQRFVVSAAGIGVELLLAALALLLALNLEAGACRDLALTVFFIGSVSTLLINGNPLLRFDGYHMLCDALELPNLASRSARHWLGALQRWLLRDRTGFDRDAEAAAVVLPAAGEAPWLWAYAPAALAYRLLIGVTLVGWLGRLSFLLGSAIALTLAWSLLGQPLLRLVRWVHGTALAETPRRLARVRLMLIGGAALAAFALLPLPYASVAQGVVWAPEHTLVRAGGDGFVETLLVADGQTVHRGQRLLRLAAPTLAAELARLDGRVVALETERYQALRRDPAQAVGLDHELDSTLAELARAEERERQLDVRAEADGIIAIAQARDLPGRYLKQGAVIAQVLTDEPTTVRVALPQALASLVQRHTKGVSVRRRETGGEAWPAALLSDAAGAAGAVANLPSAALGDASGGSIVTDPADKAHLRAAQAVVLADVRVEDRPARVLGGRPAQALGDGPAQGPGDRPESPGDRPAQRLGGRAWVRFDHGYAPLAVQAAQRAQQLLLEHFNPVQ